MGMGGVYVGLATIFLGIPSLVLLRIAEGIFQPELFSKFLSQWATLNTAVLILVVPLMSYTAHCRKLFIPKFGNQDSFECFYRAFALQICAFPIMLIQVFLWIIGNNTLTISSATSTTLYAVCFLLFNVEGSLQMSRNDFGAYLKNSLIFAALSVSILLGISRIKLTSTDHVFYIFALCYVVPLVAQKKLTNLKFESKRSSAFGTVLRSGDSYQAIRHLAFVNAISLLLLNGPVIFGKYIDAQLTDLATFSALINLVLVLATGLNTFIPVIQNSMVQSSSHTKRQIFKQATFIYTLLVLVLAVLFAGVLDEIAMYYLRSAQHTNSFINGLFIVGFCASTMVGLTRIMLTIAQRFWAMTFIWASGVAVFAVLIILISDPLYAMLSAPSVAFIWIFGLGTLYVLHKDS